MSGGSASALAAEPLVVPDDATRAGLGVGDNMIPGQPASSSATKRLHLF
jgi:hypothetical protein